MFIGEIRLAGFVAEHNLPFTIMEHLPKLIQAVCPDSKIAEEIACSRTKTHAIVEHVIGKTSFDSLCEDLRQHKFSLIIDESTDRSTIKHLCLVARYVKNYRIKDCFLGLIPLNVADAATLFGHILYFFSKNNISYRDNLIGFASDGANVMMGRNNSVATLLQNEIPNIFILKCICHSFHLSASYACKKLPRFLEDMVRDIYNYFSSSPKRIVELKEFQSFYDLKIHKILHPCQTRWLSVHAAVKRVIEQYSALKLFFIDAVSNNDLLTSENILQKLQDPTTIIFLQFLDFVLPLFTNLNKEMQAEHPKIHVLYPNICQILKTLFDCFLKRDYLSVTSIENVDFKNPRNFLKLEDIYYGALVNNTILNENLNHEQLNLFRVRCLDFYVEACQQIVTRFPLKNNPLKEVTILEAVNVKSGKTNSVISVCRLFPNVIDLKHFQDIDTEWRILRNTEKIKDFPDDVELFWEKISLLKNGEGHPMFPLLSQFVFNILSLPHSSANVERIFSAVNLMKTTQRNRLSTETIVGLLHAQRHIKGDGSNNCFNFDINKQMSACMSKEYWYKPDH